VRRSCLGSLLILAGASLKAPAFAVTYCVGSAAKLSGSLTPLVTSPYSADPRFVNPAASNFALRDGSFHLNKGAGVPPWYGAYIWRQDVYGRLRVRTEKPDVGALENQAGLFHDGFA